MSDPFLIGYWASEGYTRTPAEFLTLLYINFLPDDLSGLTFTIDRSQFPDLSALGPIDTMFGPDVDIALIMASEGWGPDGQGAALLFIVQNESGEYYWHGMVIKQFGG